MSIHQRSVQLKRWKPLKNLGRGSRWWALVEASGLSHLHSAMHINYHHVQNDPEVCHSVIKGKGKGKGKRKRVMALPIADLYLVKQELPRRSERLKNKKTD